jgi:hypothetical protein
MQNNRPKSWPSGNVGETILQIVKPYTLYVVVQW